MIEADFHIHSCYSFDSFLNPHNIVRTSLKKGLSVIAVADHGTTDGALETIKEAASTSLLVVPAIELETDAGHIMGLFVDSNIKGRSIDTALDEIKDQGGVTVLLHPGRMYGSQLKEAADRVDVIEVLNGRTRAPENFRAWELAKRLNKSVIAGSDAHLGFEIGCVRTIFDVDSCNLEDLRRLLTNGRRRLEGKESPYLVHALSFGMHVIKYGLRLV